VIAIIDYKTGNLASILNMIRKIGYDAVITSDPSEVRKASKFILPGVGHFDFGMRNLHQLGLVPVLNELVLNAKLPLLGICLGAQLITQGSEEGTEPGLGWIEGTTKAFDKSRLNVSNKIPHMGWADVTYNAQSRLFSNCEPIPRFYFVHSYHLTCNKPTDELTHCSYGYSFVAGFEKENILGVQFHPEKSHRFGMTLLKNFIEKY